MTRNRADTEKFHDAHVKFSYKTIFNNLEALSALDKEANQVLQKHHHSRDIE